MRTRNPISAGIFLGFLVVLVAGCHSPAKLGFAVQPGGAIGGEAFLVQPVVQVEDKNGKLVEKDGIQVTIALGANPGKGTLGGTATAITIKGKAEFKGLMINRVGQGYTLVAGAEKLANGTSAEFPVTPGPAASLRFATAPAPEAVVGEKWAPFSVELLDAGGNRATTSSDPVSISLTSPSGSSAGLLKAPSLAVTPQKGLAQFNELTYTKPGAISIAVTSGTLPPVSAGVNMKAPEKKKAAKGKTSSKASKPAKKKKK